MEAKNLFGFFLAIATILLFTAIVSADEITSDAYVEVEGSCVYGCSETTHNVSVVAGETITIKLWFTSLVNDTDVRVEAELEGEKLDEKTVSEVFDVEPGQRYRKVLTLQVPYELKDDFSNEITLSIEIDGKEHKTELDILLKVQRPSYNADIMSINTPQSIKAGDLIAIDIVLKNIGYNDLDDLYLTARIPALSAEKTTYVGDLVAIEPEDDNDDEDTLSARIYLRVPYNAPSGLYALEVEANNDDLVLSGTKQIAINNEFTNNLIVSEYRKIFGVGGSAEYELLIINPTNSVKVYRIVAEPSGALSVSLSRSVVAIQPDSSAAVTLTATSVSGGEYQFHVSVLSGEELVGQVTLSASVEGGVTTNDAIIILTVVLAIIFIVLLVVLIILLRKRPEKAEEFGESYY